VGAERCDVPRIDFPALRRPDTLSSFLCLFVFFVAIELSIDWDELHRRTSSRTRPRLHRPGPQRFAAPRRLRLAGPAVGAARRQPHFTPRPRVVILAVHERRRQHLESFDPKPALTSTRQTSRDALQGRAEPEQAQAGPRRRRQRCNGSSVINSFPTQIGFTRRGQCGTKSATGSRTLGECADDLPWSARCNTTDDNHGDADTVHSGRPHARRAIPDAGRVGALRPRLAQRQPAAVHLAGNRVYWKPARRPLPRPGPRRGALRIDPGTRSTTPAPRATPGRRTARRFELTGKLNQLRAVEYPDDPALAARIKSYELAFRMQKSVPEVLDFRDETEENENGCTASTSAVARLRDADAGGPAVRRARRALHSRCSTGRRRRGVGRARRAEGQPRDELWPGRSAVAGLLKDLKRRGPAEGNARRLRDGIRPDAGHARVGRRDHHIYGFATWLAGGGVKGGVVHGATDELGFHAVEHRITSPTSTPRFLHQLGLDSRKLEVPGRKRLEIDHGEPIRGDHCVRPAPRSEPRPAGSGPGRPAAPCRSRL